MKARFVLDASAVLAAVWSEPGADRVVSVLDGARISCVNLPEIVAKLIQKGVSGTHAEELIFLSS